MTSFHVEAQVNGPGTYWVKILTTADRAYAVTTVKQFKQAKVPVRMEINDGSDKR